MQTITHENEREPQAGDAGGSGVELAIMHGLACGGKVRSNQLFALGLTGISFHGEMSLERWHELMRLLKQWKLIGTVWLADAIKHGRQRFGQEEVERTLQQMEFDLMDAQRAIGIGTLAEGVRHPGLTSEHYWVLAKAELEPEMQQWWAKCAVANSLSALQLGKSIAAGEVVKGDDSGAQTGRSGGFVTIQGFRQLFDTWFRKVDNEEPIHKWSVERKRELWEELKAPVQVGLQLAHDLGIEVEAERGTDETQGADEDEELIEKCIATVRHERRATASLLQRRWRLGYTKAVAVLEILERRGVVGPATGNPGNGSSREVLPESGVAK